MLCRFGGAKKGVEEDVNVGDVVIIPAGLAHQRCLLHVLLDTVILLGQALHVIMSCLPVCKNVLLHSVEQCQKCTRS